MCWCVGSHLYKGHMVWERVLVTNCFINTTWFIYSGLHLFLLWMANDTSGKEFHPVFSQFTELTCKIGHVPIVLLTRFYFFPGIINLIIDESWNKIYVFMQGVQGTPWLCISNLTSASQNHSSYTRLFIAPNKYQTGYCCRVLVPCTMTQAEDG